MYIYIDGTEHKTLSSFVPDIAARGWAPRYILEHPYLKKNIPHSPRRRTIPTSLISRLKKLQHPVVKKLIVAEVQAGADDQAKGESECGNERPSSPRDV
jgi:hypothetical protein